MQYSSKQQQKWKKQATKVNEVMFLISKGVYILKVYSIHSTLRWNANVKKNILRTK